MSITITITEESLPITITIRYISSQAIYYYYYYYYTVSSNLYYYYYILLLLPHVCLRASAQNKASLV